MIYGLYIISPNEKETLFVKDRSKVYLRAYLDPDRTHLSESETTSEREIYYGISGNKYIIKEVKGNA